MNIPILSIFLSCFFYVTTSNVNAQNLSVKREVLGKVTDPSLGELSGIVSSRSNKGMYWVHNDSGDKARIFLLDSLTRLSSEYILEGITPIDMEDIAWVNYNGRKLLVLADIGDNLRKRKDVKLYIFEEPIFKNKKLDTIPNNSIQKLTLRFPDRAHDAEAIFVDPTDNILYLISKRDFRSILYSANIFSNKSSEHILQKRMELPFTFVTATDISSNGDSILIKNLLEIFYFERFGNETLISTFQRRYKKTDYIVEPQGEAIAFDPFRGGFVTISERPLGLDSYLYWYKFIKK